MWSENVSPKAVVEELSFLHWALKIGQMGCVLSFIMTIVSYFTNFVLQESHDLYQQISRVAYPLSITASILLAIGFYSLLRSNRSKLALPYVFTSLVGYAISWTFLLSLGLEYLIAYMSLNAATSITISLILAWMLWTINGTVSNRGLLRNIVRLTLLSLSYTYPVMYSLLYILPINTFLDVLLLLSPTIIIALVRLVLIARLFGQDQAVVIDDEIGPEASSEWL